MLLKLSAIIYLWHFIYFVASRSLENTSLYLVQLSHNRIVARVAPKVIESMCCFHCTHLCNKRITFLCWGKWIFSFVRSIYNCMEKHKGKRKRKWMFWYVALRTLVCLQTHVLSLERIYTLKVMLSFRWILWPLDQHALRDLINATWWKNSSRDQCRQCQSQELCRQRGEMLCYTIRIFVKQSWHHCFSLPRFSSAVYSSTWP